MSSFKYFIPTIISIIGFNLTNFVLAQEPTNKAIAEKGFTKMAVMNKTDHPLQITLEGAGVVDLNPRENKIVSGTGLGRQGSDYSLLIRKGAKSKDNKTIVATSGSHKGTFKWYENNSEAPQTYGFIYSKKNHEPPTGGYSDILEVTYAFIGEIDTALMVIQSEVGVTKDPRQAKRDAEAMAIEVFKALMGARG